MQGSATGRQAESSARSCPLGYPTILGAGSQREHSLESTARNEGGGTHTWALPATLLGDLLQCLLLASEYRQYMMCWHFVYRALLAAHVASASVTSVSALHAWTLRSGIAHPCMAYLHNLLHAPHFACLEPDLDTARVEGGCREDVFHDAAGQFPGPLVVLLRHVHP